MYIWSIQMGVTNQVTSWHFVVALLPSPVVECMFFIRAKNAFLGGFKDYDICIRTDKHSQSIYGPSATESPGRDGVHHVSLAPCHWEGSAGAAFGQTPNE